MPPLLAPARCASDGDRPPTAGFYTSTFTNSNLNDQTRGGLVQPDGKIISAGFTVVPTGVGAQTSNRIVIVRLWSGALDQTGGRATWTRST